jgi:trimeric autotransporter adhesin
MRTKPMKGTMHTSILLSHIEGRPRSLMPAWMQRCLLANIVAIACLALVATSQAVTPAPDGGYPNANTAEGNNALSQLDTNSGAGNTAVGQSALASVQTGGANTAVGAEALARNVASYNTAVGGWALQHNFDGGSNTASGYFAMINLTTGNENTATGFQALQGAVGNNGIPNSTGSFNTATGSRSLFSNQSSDSNTADGALALYSNTTASYNTAIGANAMQANTTGCCNTADGEKALYSNQTGELNVAVGGQAMYKNIDGDENTATGVEALHENTNGFGNAAYGRGALYNNKQGNYNTATGYNALYYNTTNSGVSGAANTATGAGALIHNTTGHDNVANGYEALGSNSTGNNNVALGSNAGFNLTTGSNNIVIGAGVLGKAAEANTTRIGKTTQAATYIGGISGKTVASASAVAVFVDSTGKLGTVKSSARYKDNIKPMDKASEAILKLEPVTFRYKHELDPDGVTQFGLIAEQVEKVDPDLVVRDQDGKVSTVRYEAVNAMLLNEFLKEHRRGEAQQEKIVELTSKLKAEQRESQARFAQQQAEIEALKTGLQKVSAQLELNKPLTQVTLNQSTNH